MLYTRDAHLFQPLRTGICRSVLTCQQLTATVDVAKCCQRHVRQRHLLVTLSVQLCVQRDGRHADLRRFS